MCNRSMRNCRLYPVNKLFFIHLRRWQNISMLRSWYIPSFGASERMALLSIHTNCCFHYIHINNVLLPNEFLSKLSNTLSVIGSRDPIASNIAITCEHSAFLSILLIFMVDDRRSYDWFVHVDGHLTFICWAFRRKWKRVNCQNCSTRSWRGHHHGAQRTTRDAKFTPLLLTGKMRQTKLFPNWNEGEIKLHVMSTLEIYVHILVVFICKKCDGTVKHECNSGHLACSRWELCIHFAHAAAVP